MKVVRSGILDSLKLIFKEINLFLVEEENKKPEEERKLKEYLLDIRERDLLYPLFNDQGEEIGTGKLYYGTAVIYYREEGKTYVVWRQEMRFKNATERTRDFLWKERVAHKMLYEAVGVFITFAEQEYKERREYDLETDRYVLTPEEEKLAQEKAEIRVKEKMEVVK